MLDSNSLTVLKAVAEEMDMLLPWFDDFQKPEFAPPDFMNELIPDLDEEIYHKDLSAVARGDIIAYKNSPAHMKVRRQTLDPNANDDESLRFGRALHMLLLEPHKFKTRYVLMPTFVGKTTTGKESTRCEDAKEKKELWLAEQKANKRMVVTKEDMIHLFGMTVSISKNPYAMWLFEGATFELTGYYRDPETGLKCRVRADMYNEEKNALVDLKSCEVASFDSFQKTCEHYRYDIQLAMYSHGLETIMNKKIQHKVIIAVEKTPPYGLIVYPCNTIMMDRGYRAYRKSLNGIAQSVLKNEWPVYPEEPVTMTPPRWAENKE